jgi:uncharacterized protein YvpB
LARVSDAEFDEKQRKTSTEQLDREAFTPRDGELLAELDAEAFAELVVDPDPELDPDLDPSLDAGFDSDAETDLDPDPDPNPNPNPDPDPEQDPDPGLKSDPNPDAETDIESDPNPIPDSNPKSDPNSDVKPNPNPNPNPDPDPDSNSKSDPNPDAEPDEKPDEVSGSSSTEDPAGGFDWESAKDSLASHRPSLKVYAQIEELVNRQIRHLVSMFKLFGTASLALVFVLSIVGWLRIGNSSAVVQDDLETAPVMMVVENLVPKANALLRDAGDITRESQGDATDAANALRAGWYEENGNRYYYYQDGTKATGVVEIDGVIVTFDDEGRWVSSRLDVPYISQLPEMPFGCEAVAVTMMLNYADVNVSKEEVAAQLPYSNDPAEGFTGSVYYADEGYDSGGIIWPSALLELVRGYRGSAVDLTGASWEVVRDFIDQGKTVCVWFTDGGLDHTVLLVGYSENTVWVNDPLVDKDVVLDLGDFLRYWEQNGYRALSW